MKPTLLLAATFLAASLTAKGAITYVDAKTTNTTGLNAKWSERTGMPTNDGNVFQTFDDGDVPELTTTVNVASGIYDVYVFFWDQNLTTGDNNWDISAGLTVGSLTAFQGNSAPDASDLTFVSNPIFTGTSLTMRYGYLGQVTVSDGTLEVFVDNFIEPSGSRTWYDGVGYEFVAIPEPSSPSLLGLAMAAALLRRRRR